MVTTVYTSALSGVDSIPVAVEVEARSGGKINFQIIGLGDNAVKESRNRVVTALQHQGFKVPEQILVNLAPAEIKKEGASFDLPIAIGILVTSKQLPKSPPRGVTLYGELSLDGSIKPVRGISACVAEARRLAQDAVLVPYENLPEASLIDGVTTIGFRSLLEVVQFLREGTIPPQPQESSAAISATRHTQRLSDVLGQHTAKRALVVAAAGGHNLLMIGPPGCGKSMLAERFSALLPPLTVDERLECVKVHSVAGLSIDRILVGERPLRTPHYIISDPGLVGGGNPPRPGEITLAHNGVLFLDEFPEFRRSALEALRVPLESGRITIARARHCVTLPARFQLLAAMNPCPCGKLGSETRGQGGCNCPRAAVGWYLRKLSQPILDRIDLHVELSSVPVGAIAAPGGPSDDGAQEQITAQISAAQRRQRGRNGGMLNAHLPQELLKNVSALTPDALQLLEKAAERLGLSARGYMRMVRVARTVADLSDSAGVGPVHVAEAVSYRGLDRLKRYAESAF
ncbi:MAG: ATP-binding protein [Proteobacteria bacterium]|nr:ATP-binding protein [Pseudomonadota bacterium]